MDIPGLTNSNGLVSEASNDNRQHAHPFFSNPFMAPFLPQNGNTQNLSDLNSDRSSLSPHSSSSNPSPNDPYLLQQQQKSDFRMNPLTGGYFLSPDQYQQMMNQYMQNLIIAAQSSGNNVNEHITASTTLPSNNADVIQNLFPMTSANLDNTHEEPDNRLCSSPPVSDSPSLVDSTVKNDTTEHQSKASNSSSPTPNDTIDVPLSNVEQPPTLNNEVDLPESQKDTELDDQIPSTSPKIDKTESVQSIEKAERVQSVDKDVRVEKTERVENNDPRRPMDPNAIPANQQQKPPTVNLSSTEERTSELIKKQMNEIEKEISRRMQNQNIRKMDEMELAQLLNEHGFGNFVDANSENGANQTTSSDFSVDFTNQSQHGIPYRPPQVDTQQAGKPTLEQLRSSFSPPDDQPILSNSMIDTASYNFGMTSSGSGFGLHGPAAFATSSILPQTISPANYRSQSPISNGHYTATAIPTQQQSFQFINPNQTQQMMFNGAGSPFNYMNYVQGQPPLNQMSQPYAQQFNTSMGPTITPEMAAALLHQLQQQNPTLLQNLVGQHNFANSTSQPVTNTNQSNRVNTQQFENVDNAVKCTAVPQSTATQKQQVSGIIPAPPLPKNSINRKSSDGHSMSTTQRQYPNENGWPTTSNQTVTSNQPVDTEPACENKENGQDPPVWVMRETFLKRMQREEQRIRQNGCNESEQNEIESDLQQTVSNAENVEVEEEETDKLIKKDHNEIVEEAVRGQSRKGSNKKEVIVHEPAVLIEGVLFRARYLGSTQLVSDGRATKSSRMAQAQEAVSRVKAPDGESQPSTEIDLFISTEKIMVLNTDLQRISETDVRQDIVIDLILKSVSYIADIGDLVVLIARRIPQANEGGEEDIESIRKTPRMICHVFESEEASFIVQSIGQAFQVAYVEFLRANGIDDPAYLREIDYQEVLNSQELMGEELEMFARKETQKDVIVPKKVGEALGVVVVESGWGSMLPTVVLANLAPGGPAARSNQLNIGDQIIAINGISLVGLPLIAAQQNIKNAKTSTAVRLTVVSTPPVVEVRIKRPDTKYQLGFSVQNGVICSLLRGGIAERGGIRVGHRIIEINGQSVVAVQHEKIVNMLATATGEIHMKTMPTSMFRLLTGQEVPNYI